MASFYTRHGRKIIIFVCPACIFFCLLTLSFKNGQNDSTTSKSNIKLDDLKQNFDQYDDQINQMANQMPADSDTNEKFDDEFIANWDQDDPRLIEHIRKKYLYPPAQRNVPYKLDKEMVDYSLYNASAIVNKTFGGMKGGFFIECGGYDGEDLSNTLMFERYLNWTGILIEPQPDNFQRLMSKNRKSWVVNGCIHGASKPKINTIFGPDESSILKQYVDDKRKMLNSYVQGKMKQSKAWCFPIYSILMAINRTKIDYFVLDVEGAEMDILENFPFNKIDVNIMQIEWVKFEEMDENKEKSAKLKEFIKNKHPEYELLALTPLDILYKKKA